MTAQRDKIQGLLDAMLAPPTEDNDSPELLKYFERCQNANQALGFSSFVDSGTRLDKCLYLRNVVMQRLNDITSLSDRAPGAGLILPPDPSIRLIGMNAGRRVMTIIQESPVHIELLDSLTTLSEMVQKEQNGEISLTRSPRPQVSSINMSFDAIDGLPSDIFDADSLKRQQSLEKLALLDFTKRKVKMLFVAEYEHDSSVDLVVGWKKIRDATGYRVTTREVFSGRENTIDIPSSALESTPEDVKTFYTDMLHPIVGVKNKMTDVALFTSRKVQKHALYSVIVTPFQKVSSSRNDLFRVPLNRITLSSMQLDQLEKLIKDFGVQNPDSMTPYPFLSELLYGSRKFGWVLAGLNVLSSFERGEELASVRDFSYIGASLTSMKLQLSQGRLFAPADMNSFVERLGASFSNFGLSNTLAESLEKCGVLMFFDEREGFDVNSLTMDRQSALRETSVVAAILSAIDVETATVTPSAVYGNVTNTIPQVAGTWQIQILQVSLVGVQPIPKLDTSNELIDLLSFEGVSRLMDVIVDASRKAG